jgi:hypothetical protein
MPNGSSSLDSQRRFRADRAAIAQAAAGGHKFSGDINGLNPVPTMAFRAFLLASIARIRYPVGRLACERPWP